MTACAGAASETATQEGAVDEESQGAIREAVTENDQAQEQPKTTAAVSVRAVVVAAVAGGVFSREGLS